MEDPGSIVVFQFGSRSGSYVALVFFGSLFGIAGWAVAREIRQRGARRRSAAVVGMVLFVALLTILHWSSLGGFYEAEVRGEQLLLHYLLAPGPQALSLGSLTGVKATPAFRGLWCLQLEGRGNRRYESATSDRPVVERVLEQLRPMVANASQAR